ncbi:hypothetical protein CEXT_168571 [Caerostris extrusa]|uniref:Uncharacterized protein n=1 Tax=Caerostris extrusa TaxID=172846 RepID=A0AAV4PDZ8_CAEEX|nr:hypothetical protein CEXT_168571 [Caerostris extrusa]
MPTNQSDVQNLEGHTIAQKWRGRHPPTNEPGNLNLQVKTITQRCFAAAEFHHEQWADIGNKWEKLYLGFSIFHGEGAQKSYRGKRPEETQNEFHRSWGAIQTTHMRLTLYKGCIHPRQIITPELRCANKVHPPRAYCKDCYWPRGSIMSNGRWTWVTMGELASELFGCLERCTKLSEKRSDNQNLDTRREQWFSPQLSAQPPRRRHTFSPSSTTNYGFGFIYALGIARVVFPPARSLHMMCCANSPPHLHNKGAAANRFPSPEMGDGHGTRCAANRVPYEQWALGMEHDRRKLASGLSDDKEIFKSYQEKASKLPGVLKMPGGQGVG